MTLQTSRWDSTEYGQSATSAMGFFEDTLRVSVQRPPLTVTLRQTKISASSAPDETAP